MKLCMNKITCVNRFVLHTLNHSILYLVVITRETTMKIENFDEIRAEGRSFFFKMEFYLLVKKEEKTFSSEWLILR